MGDLKNGTFIAFVADTADAAAAARLRDERLLWDYRDAFVLSSERLGKLFCLYKEMVQ